MKYIMAHDMGTSSDKAVLIDFNGNIVASKAVPYPTYYPAPAFVEQEPEEYWEAVCLASKTIMQDTGIDPGDVEGVGYGYHSHRRQRQSIAPQYNLG